MVQDFLREILSGALQDGILPPDEPGADVAYLIGLLTNGLVLLFVYVILSAIVFAIISGMKFITSQGESDKVQEAKDSLRSVFIGVLSVFVGVVVILVLSGVFAEEGSNTVRRLMCQVIEPNVPVEDCIEGSK